jgi:hypothetical protein
MFLRCSTFVATFRPFVALVNVLDPCLFFVIDSQDFAVVL